MKHNLVGRVVSILAGTVCLALVPIAAQAPAGPTGHWEGTIQVPGQELAISVDLSLNADATWEGTIAIPAQNVKALPLSDITVKQSAVGFAMKGVPGDPQFAGTVSKDGKSIAGDFSQGGATLPFALVWKGEARPRARVKSTSIAKDLEGTWEGVLNVEGTVLRLILKLSNAESGATGTLVSVDQGGGEIAIHRYANRLAPSAQRRCDWRRLRGRPQGRPDHRHVEPGAGNPAIGIQADAELMRTGAKDRWSGRPG